MRGSAEGLRGKSEGRGAVDGERKGGERWTVTAEGQQLKAYRLSLTAYGRSLTVGGLSPLNAER
jgi:hypothetical protein